MMAASDLKGTLASCLGLLAVMWIAGCAPGEDKAAPPPAAGEEAVEAEKPVDIPSYLEHTAWPPKFQASFTNYLSHDPDNPTAGTIYYDASDRSAIRMKTFFEVCPPLPCVSAEWMEAGAACWFYLVPDPDYGTASYVFTEGLGTGQQQYTLIGNVGALHKDFVARYHQEGNDAPPLDQPGDWFVPVGNPSDPSVQVQWFLTSDPGTEPDKEGYFAAVAEPLTVWNDQSFKPPYAFGGDAPAQVSGFHERGELAYDWENWDLDPDFGPIELPDLGNYTQVDAPLCPMCYPSDPSHPCEGGPPPPPGCNFCHSVPAY